MDLTTSGKTGLDMTLMRWSRCKLHLLKFIKHHIPDARNVYYGRITIKIPVLIASLSIKDKTLA